MTRCLILFFALSLGQAASAADTEVIDVAVQGMSCPFCVYNVEKKLRGLDGVDQANVNLEQGRARVVMKPGVPMDKARLKQAIVDSGFTPGEITVSDDAAPAKH